jgi:hypothetical protein
MQKCPIYLYTNLFEVILDLDQNNRVHNIMYQRNLQVQKGLKNRIQIQFKNSDQKLLNVSSSTFVFSMFDNLTQRQLVRKDLSIIDIGTTSTKGLALLELSESDTLDLDTGLYKFSVAQIDSDGSYQPTYSNTYYGVSGQIEIRQDSFPVLTPSEEIVSFIPQYNYNVDEQRYEYYSGNIPAHPEFNGNTALHTVAIYMTKFKGTVKIQGTLSNSPGHFADYSTIKTLNYNGFTGIGYANFNGVFSFIRIIYVPTKNPVTGRNDNTEIAYRGTVDKALYRS